MTRSRALRAALSGALSLAVLTGMLVRHAWPLWTGEVRYLRVQPYDTRDMFRGDYVMLNYDIQTLSLRLPPSEVTPRPAPEYPADVTPPPPPPSVDVVGDWWRADRPWRWWHDRRLYVQLREEPSSDPGVPARYVPVSISDAPVEGAVNLEGRVRYFDRPYTVNLHYGLDAFYVREGRARSLVAPPDGTQTMHAEIAVTPGGQARVRALIVDGVRVE